jgi:hypothetical protein
MTNFRGNPHMDATASLSKGLWTCLTLIVLFLLPCFTHAQGLSGISGTVTDGTNSVVPAAAVSVTNNATGVVSRTQTNEIGTYIIIDLIPGAYTIRIEKAGFETRVITGVNVDVSRTTTANAALKMGSAAETVEVKAPSISLETTQPQLGTIIEPKIVDEIPIIIGGGPGSNGARDRQIDDYLYLAAGVQGGESNHRINGGLNLQNEVVFNGVPVAQAESQGVQTLINPPFELVGEIQVLTSNFSAQYGLAQGVASYQFASGANKFHGDGFEVVRNTVFNAAGANPGFKTDGTKLGAPSINENNYGFTFGGPVWLPKLYKGTNRTFFHFSADWFRLNQKDTATMTIPTQQMVGGDFGALLSLAKPETIYVPQGFVAPAGCAAPAPGQPWPNNVIPSGCFSTVSASLLPLVPHTSLPGLSNNATSEIGALPTRQTNVGFSIDHNLTETQKLHGSFWDNQWSNTQCCSGNAHFANQLGALYNLPRSGRGLVATYSNVLTPNLVMTAGFDWIRERNDGTNLHRNLNFAGVASDDAMPIINFNQNGLPNGLTRWGRGGGFDMNHKVGMVGVNNWLWNYHRHTLNMGWEIRRTYQDDQECSNSCDGVFGFSNRTTADPASTSSTGNAFASFLLGEVDSASRQYASLAQLSNAYFAPYIQDDFKITSRLTINAGLRWNLMVPFSEKHNNAVFFDPTIPNTAAVTGDGKTLMGAATKFGTSGYDRANMYFRHFGPRVGFAYQWNNKTSILTGFSWDYLDGGPYEYGANVIAKQFTQMLNGMVNKNSNNSNIPGYGEWDGNPLVHPEQTAFNSASFNGTGVLRQFSKNPGHYPYSESWNFGVERQLPQNWLLMVSYVGTKDVHLASMVNPLNQTNPKYLKQFCSSANPDDPNCLMSGDSPNHKWTSVASQNALMSAGFAFCPDAAGGHFAPYCNFMKDYGANAGLAQALLPHPMFNPSESAGGLTNTFDMNGTAFYNALQASVQKRFSQGYSILANYTLSRSMSNTDEASAYVNYGALNGFDQKSEWTVASNDQTHMVNIATVYELPIGPGTPFLNGGGLLAKNLVGGWQLSGTFQYASGTPMSVYSSTADPFQNGFNRANYDHSVPLHVNYNNYYKGKSVFNTAAFSDPGFAGGDSPRNLSTLRSPFNSNENLAFAKHFYIGEHVTAELRMELFNVLNRMQVCTPDSTVSDAATSFGLVSPNGTGGSNPCQKNTPRQGQAFFKLNF